MAEPSAGAGPRPPEEERLSVLFTTEGTYPFMGGGVSTWCHILCECIPEIDWHLFAVVGDPYGEDKYETDKFPQIQSVTRIPLWGAEETAEYIDQRPFRHAFLAKLATTQNVIETKFLPLFTALLRGFEADGNDMTEYGPVVHRMYLYFQQYDYNVTIKSQPVWNYWLAFCNRVCRDDPSFRDCDRPCLFDVTTAMRWFYNMCIPISAKIPECDVSHASIAASCALANIVAKFEYQTPFLLTDHGVYIRERYIACSAAEMGFFCKRFLVKLAGFFTRLSYFFADQVSPCAHFNARWELPFGCSIDRNEKIDFSDWEGTGVVPSLEAFAPIEPTYKALVDHGMIDSYDRDTVFPWVRTIYNGVDTERFVPGEKPPERQGRPTCVALARVFPLKDVLTMIRSCAVVKEQLPDILYIVYGSLKADPPYVQRCRDLIEELELQDNFELAGFHSKPHQAFWEGDISVLSSISEGFPFTVLESMAAGVPVVGTDVGGCKEAIGMGADACGIVVPPQDPRAFGEGVVKMLTDDLLRAEMARKGRDRIVRLFKTATSVDAYRESYNRLSEVGRDRRAEAGGHREQVADAQTGTDA